MRTAGVVLAGGQSSRYGRPKMFEMYKEKPFYEYSVDAFLANRLDPIIISTNEQLAAHFHASGVVFSLDKVMYNGPLYALSRVMEDYPEPEWFFVLSADVPFVTAAFAGELLACRHLDYSAIVPVHENKLQPLLALYHRRCLPVLNQVLQENKRSFMALLDNIKFKTIPFPKDELSFININKQEDFENYKQ